MQCNILYKCINFIDLRVHCKQLCTNAKQSFHPRNSPDVVPGPAAPTSPENLLEINFSGPHTNTPNQNSERRAQHSVLTNPQAIPRRAKVWEPLYHLISSQGKISNKLFLIQAFIEVYPICKVFSRWSLTGNDFFFQRTYYLKWHINVDIKKDQELKTCSQQMP